MNLYRMTVESDGLSFVYSAGAGKGKLQLEKNMKMDCYDLNARFGAGHAFLNSDDMVFALHVFAGIGVKYARGPQSGIDIEALEYRMPFGADASFVMKLSERFSLCAGFDLSVNFLGFGSFMIETGDGSSSKGYTIDYLFSGLNAVPHLGFCWLL